jgi:membrane-associated phospholipid phosphatase
MKTAIPTISPHSWDMALQSIDSLLIGQNLSLLSQSITHPWLTELFSACYLLFFPYLLFSIISYSRSELELAKKFSIGLFTIYGLGFLGYSFVPASGPWKAMASQFHVPLDGWALTHLNNAVVTAGTNGVDVFPSLHCAVSAFFLFFDREHRPWRFKLYLLPCVGLWLSTVYLRYHYFTDIICGFGLAAFALCLSRRYASSRSTSIPHSHSAEIALT